MKKTFEVEGMSCVICKSNVEKALLNLNGVKEVSVNLMDNEVLVDFNEELVNPKDFYNTLKDNGYKLILHKTNKDYELLNLIVSSILVIILMYLSMGHTQNKYLLLIISTIIYILNGKYFKSGLKALLSLKPNMDSLVSISALVSYLYSLVILLINNPNYHLYFESGSMILLIVSIGKRIEKGSKKKTTKVIRGLSTLIPMNANLYIDNKIKVIKIEEIKKGDTIKVLPGESIPQDGIVLDGISSIDESLITGEAIPQIKKEGDLVIGGSINIDGSLTIKVNKNYTQTALSKIISLTKQASLKKIPIEKITDKISNYFVFSIISISLLTFIIWMIVSNDIELSLYFSLSVLVIACPCALGLATPSAIAVSIGQASKNKILIKNPEILEIMPKLKNIILDKTGTLTENKLEIESIKEYDSSFIKILTSLEKYSTHPIAKAIIEKYSQGDLDFKNIQLIPGEGIVSNEYIAGNKTLLDKYKIKINEEDLNYATYNNYSFIGLANKKELLGIIYLKDKIKESSIKAIEGFNKRKINSTMATGDNELAAKKLANKLGIKEYKAALLPIEKEELLISKKNNGITAMVGDGINDAICLTRADISISLNSGTDIAMASSDIILIDNDLNKINYLYDLSKKTMKTIKLNLFFALLYNSLCIPIAAGILYKYGITLKPIYGSIAMSLSSIFVLSNSLRIRSKHE